MLKYIILVRIMLKAAKAPQGRRSLDVTNLSLEDATISNNDDDNNDNNVTIIQYPLIMIMIII